MSDNASSVPAGGGLLPDGRRAGASGGKKPGIVIFVAVLHFFATALFVSLSLFCLLAMGFGSAWGIDDYLARQVSQFSPPNYSYGLTILFGAALFVFVCFSAFFLTMAIGLLKAKKFAWYLQIAFSTLGLLSFPLGFLWSIAVLPLGSILNIVILVFFFRSRVREFFQV